MTSQPTPKVTEILAGAGDMAGEGRAGATFPALFAMIARRHMYQYGTTREQMAAVAVKNHANGAKNPLAHMRKVITMEQALAGKPIAEPLTVYDCSLISDGAAAVLIAPLERAGEFTEKPVKILGIAQTSDYVALDQKDDITTFRAVKAAGEKAYKMAGVTPRDIQFAEVHDCFTIAEIIATEDLGFVKKGEGGPYALQGCTCVERSAPGQHQRRTEVERPSGGRDRGRADLRCGDANPRRSRRAPDRAAFARASRRIWAGRARPLWSPFWGRHESGTIYTETLIQAAPEQFVADAPYQLVIVALDGGKRLTARVDGDRVAIGDKVVEAESRDGIPFFKKA